MAHTSLLFESTGRSLGFADLMAILLLSPGVLAAGAMGIDPDATPMLGKALYNSINFVFFAIFGVLWTSGRRVGAVLLGVSSTLFLAFWLLLFGP